MKKVLTYWLFIVLSLSITAGVSKPLTSDRSVALVSDISDDISQTLAQINRIEGREGGRSWTVKLSRGNSKLIRVGVIIEPATQQVLSVTVDGIGNILGLRVGDVIKNITKNDVTIDTNLSQIVLTHGDDLSLTVNRGDDTLKLQTVVSSNFIPTWQLFSDSATQSIKADISKSKEFKPQNIKSPLSLELLKKLQQRINVTLGEVYKLESKNAAKELIINIHQPRATETRLGLTIAPDTGRVLMVEDGSNAQKLGFKARDVIQNVEINGQQYSGDLASLTLNDKDQLAVTIERQGKPRVLKSTVAASSIPSWALNVGSYADTKTEQSDACGVITMFFDPPFTQDIYKAQLTEVDGNLQTRFERTDTVTLKAGKHQLLIHEEIPSRLKRREGSGKLVEFLVQPNKRYFLGVKFDRSKRFTKSDAFWQPYVWKVEDYNCSLDWRVREAL